MRLILAALFIGVMASIAYTQFATVPRCLNATLEDEACRPKNMTKEMVRQQQFEEWARDSERIEEERRSR